jgi:hypothetical protein
MFKNGDSELPIGSRAFSSVAPTKAYFGRQMDFTTVPCAVMETVEFGENVTSIKNGAFKKGTAIRDVISHSAMPPTTDDTFSNETYLDGVLYVPEASIEAYQVAAGWKNFWEFKQLSEYNSVNEIAVDNGDDAIFVDNGVISVNSDRQVRIVATNGSTVYGGRGATRVSVAPGIYVVIIGNTAHKVAVR